MKKLFISCPMRGRTQEAIEATIGKLHAIAEVIFEERLEVVNYYGCNGHNNNGVKTSVCRLGEAIAEMSGADFFIGCIDTWEYPGCEIERTVAERYGLFDHNQIAFIPFMSVAGDYDEIFNKMEKERMVDVKSH